MKTAFGFTGKIGVLPTDDVPLQSMIQSLDEVTARRDELEMNRSHSKDQGPKGLQARVLTVPAGLQFTLGGPAMFQSGSALLTEAGHQAVVDLAASGGSSQSNRGPWPRRQQVSLAGIAVEDSR